MSAALEILPEVREFVETQKIGRVEGDRIVLCGKQRLRPFVVPSVVVGDTLLSGGLDYLRGYRPPVVVMLVRYDSRDGFERIIKYGTPWLDNPVIGVRCRADTHTKTQLSPPVSQEGWRAEQFQKAMLEWFSTRGTTLLPLSPQYAPLLTIAQQRLISLSAEMGLDAGLSREAKDQLRHLIYTLLNIYDVWGVLGEFGKLLQHPQVVALGREGQGRIPLILDVEFAYVAAILRHYGADVITLDLRTKISGMGLAAHFGDASVDDVTLWEELADVQTQTGYVLARNLAVRPPFSF